MRKWLLFTAIILALPARAQTGAVGQKIEYRRDLPKSVARLMPRGAKSLFWGRFTPKAGSAPMAIHLFALNPRSEFNSRSAVETKYHFVLDVFDRRGKIFQRIRSVPIVYQSQIWGPVRISARLFWLNSATKSAPVLIFNCSALGETFIVGSDFGDAVFTVFPAGWLKAAAVQTFAYGVSSYSTKSYEIVDDKGSGMQIIASEAMPGSFDGRTFEWNSKKSHFEVKSWKENGYDMPLAPTKP